MDIWNITEIVASVGCAIYVVLQAKQKSIMWYINLVSSSAALALYLHSSLWGSAAINMYYIAMAFVGIYQWGKDSKKVEHGTIHIKKISGRIAAISAAIAVFGGGLIYLILLKTGDASPVLDALVFTMSIIGTWWLTRSHVEQWLIWLVADSIGVALNLTQGLYLMAALYAFCNCTAFYGLYNWKKNGKYID